MHAHGTAPTQSHAFGPGPHGPQPSATVLPPCPNNTTPSNFCVTSPSIDDSSCVGNNAVMHDHIRRAAASGRLYRMTGACGAPETRIWPLFSQSVQKRPTNRFRTYAAGTCSPDLVSVARRCAEPLGAMQAGSAATGEADGDGKRRP
jgi:hypothetical protein